MDVDRIRSDLVAQRGKWRDIAARAKVSTSWLSKFANGHIVSPRVATATRVQAALADEATSVAA